MRFVGDAGCTGVHHDIPEIDIDRFIDMVKRVASEVGDKTRERLHAAIEDGGCVSKNEDGISFRDTLIYGRYYVYLWFDMHGELFYIGKGTSARVEDFRTRSAKFREKAESGYYKILASGMKEDYALDLEKILIMEAVKQGQPILNKTGGEVTDIVQYCSGDRDCLLWYWNHLGVISRFSELTGVNVLYDARGCGCSADYISPSSRAIGERLVWWGYSQIHPETNDPEILRKIREAKEKEEVRKEKRRLYNQRRREEATA